MHRYVLVHIQVLFQIRQQAVAPEAAVTAVTTIVATITAIIITTAAVTMTI